ncbi:glutathione S-transferase [Novosphingobium sp. CF614]|uniref:glutathione S-transferase family protein n=1 Tax=Novosphingobium sp. CF614 TaxID=1884364 RepID=UPI0008E7B182|nr:glutathione S-transferase family protein [Novosphingobium sp. CF614]SFF78129.1 glutathione S-transferase [Novosphingobium sp. CF614]
MLKLIIGNKNYSSWSMRAWMLLKFAELPFSEICIDLYTAGSRKRVLDLGGETGLVPVLVVDDRAIWDTLAITEFVYELRPHIWPSDAFERAKARSYAGEVHSGLTAVRASMPCNTRARERVVEMSEEVELEIARVAEIWSRASGDWLFGDFSAADVMFAPVAARFRTYGVALKDGRAVSYWERLIAHPLCTEWFALGEAEPVIIEQFELPRRIK